MSVNELQAHNAPQVRTHSSEAAEKDADFLALRLLNKRARVNLSSQPFDLSPVEGRLSSVSIILAPLADLHLAFAEATADNDKAFQPQRKLPLNGAIPTTLVFAYNDTRLLVGVTEGSIAATFLRWLRFYETAVKILPTYASNCLTFRHLNRLAAGEEPTGHHCDVNPKSIIPHPPWASNQSVISNVWFTSSSFFTIYGPRDNLAQIPSGLIFMSRSIPPTRCLHYYPA
ncbi:hypothetical protein BJ138DRAFT_1207996 [Hygrophoropsis aurantiaca]|uniref:Uncharacterized protein n=1 Tax=Hygrophoropsis aurantiaca TaxID=72124 RepID=A0ACB8A622_9AGAM|nr:hypothetical protein BJ138DRAFT_1207996 [Hygrophoropsis aurantiaca]